MQAELQTALFNAFDTLNLQQMKSFNVPPVTLHGVGALAACGPQAQSRGLRHLFVMVDSFLHQAGMTAGLERSLAMKGIAMTLWPCPAGEPCVTDVCAAVAQLRDARCDGVVAFGGGSVLDAAKAVALRSGSGGAGKHAAGFLHGGDGVFQRRAGAMPCHGASAGGGAAYSTRSGQRHAAANGDGV